MRPIEVIIVAFTVPFTVGVDGGRFTFFAAPAGSAE